MHISTVPLPQYMTQYIVPVPVPVASYTCEPCCPPCDVEYPVADSYNSDIVPVGPFPAPIGFNPNDVQIEAPLQSDNNSNQIPSGDTTNPAPDNSVAVVSNGMNTPMDNLIRLKLSKLVQNSDNVTDYYNNFNSFFYGMTNNK